MVPSRYDRLRPLATVASLLAIVAGLTAHARLRERFHPPAAVEAPPDRPEPSAQVVVVPPAKEAPPPSDAPPQPPAAAPPAPAPAPAPAPPLDIAAVARATAALDAASRDRARAEARAKDAAGRLQAAANQAALDAANARKLASRIKDPSTRITQVAARGGFLRADVDKLRKEVAALRALPRPKATSILTKSPVARPAAGDEFHFELRRNRISFINLERLLDLAKADAQLRIRMADRTGLIQSQVGPVGSFSLAYVLGRAGTGIDELIERQSIRFDLKGWEVVPEHESRGEAYEATRNPISAYAQAVNRLTAGRSVVTFWVYPDSFPLFRALRAELTDRGFSVAGRPLPEGMTIRGSPMGSVSAAQ
ncbi:hypothetical protein OJF2_40740 [Aquisphaera giovannonii]|uniref:Uncharacterized protein n=1 Tax=Aquisphaera giovannonii TaxID=406548 RepID=A0A5B9W4P1_9BACT|nr:hypothetical protein [Aquisphaera giovannonii]QEH35522.1 hypothetical protein OJF2_40740 [Aquisphaera giovannonii]